MQRRVGCVFGVALLPVGILLRHSNRVPTRKLLRLWFLCARCLCVRKLLQCNGTELRERLPYRHSLQCDRTQRRLHLPARRVLQLLRAQCRRRVRIGALLRGGLLGGLGAVRLGFFLRDTRDSSGLRIQLLVPNRVHGAHSSTCDASGCLFDRPAGELLVNYDAAEHCACPIQCVGAEHVSGSRGGGRRSGTVHALHH